LIIINKKPSLENSETPVLYRGLTVPKGKWKYCFGRSYCVVETQRRMFRFHKRREVLECKNIYSVSATWNGRPRVAKLHDSS